MLSFYHFQKIHISDATNTSTTVTSGNSNGKVKQKVSVWSTSLSENGPGEMQQMHRQL